VTNTADYSVAVRLIRGINDFGSHLMDAMLCVRAFLSELNAWQWLGILLARIAVGLLFFLSGRGKLFVPERREQMRQTLIEAHVPLPEFNAVFVSTIEFVCGALLILGALTPLACVMLGSLMIVAIATTGDSKCSSDVSTPLALGISVSSRSALLGDSFLAFFLRPGLAQHRPLDPFPLLLLALPSEFSR
jgi:uncharacterized membrane protein YphA (DoxX/SURF4 family)